MTTQRMFGKTGAIYTPQMLELARNEAIKALGGGDKGTAKLAVIREKIEDKANKAQVCLIGDLHVDTEAQRHSGLRDTTLALKAAVKIIKDFDINAFETTSVALRSKSGVKAVVDGGHRGAVAAIAGADRVPADQWVSEGEAYEASVFAKMNMGRRGVSSVIKVRTQAIANPSSPQRQTIDAIKAAGLKPDTDTFKGLNSLVTVMKVLGKRLGIEEAQMAIRDGLSLYGEIWDGYIEQDVAAALIHVLVDTKMTDEQIDLFEQNVRAQWEYVPELMEHVKPLVNSSHAHGKGRVDATYAELLTMLPDDVDLEASRQAKAEREAEDREFDGDGDGDEAEGHSDDAPVEAPDGQTFMIADFLKESTEAWTANALQKALAAEGTKVAEDAIQSSLDRLLHAKLVVVDNGAYAFVSNAKPKPARKSRAKASA